MSDILTLESPQELLRIKREYILGEIALYGEREQVSFQEFMYARKARKDLEAQLLEFDTAIDILEELV